MDDLVVLVGRRRPEGDDVVRADGVALARRRPLVAVLRRPLAVVVRQRVAHLVGDVARHVCEDHNEPPQQLGTDAEQEGGLRHGEDAEQLEQAPDAVRRPVGADELVELGVQIGGVGDLVQDVGAEPVVQPLRRVQPLLRAVEVQAVPCRRVDLICQRVTDEVGGAARAVIVAVLPVRPAVENDPRRWRGAGGRADVRGLDRQPDEG